MPTAAAGGGRYITHAGELVGAPPILSRTRCGPIRLALDPSSADRSRGEQVRAYTRAVSRQQDGWLTGVFGGRGAIEANRDQRRNMIAGPHHFNGARVIAAPDSRSA